MQKDLNDYLIIINKQHNLVGEYKYSEEDGCFIGDIINVSDLISFQGDTEYGIIREFNEAVDDYVSFCAEIGKSIPYLWMPYFNQNGRFCGILSLQ